MNLAPDRPPGSTDLLGTAWKVLAATAGFLVLFLGVGLALPGTWTAERETTVGAGPDSVFGFLEAPGRWQLWNPWPDVRVTPSGPDRGVGAEMSWDDPYAGSGRFTILESRAPTHLTYKVEVEGGSIRTSGVLELRKADRGTRVRWREDGDFGWNPLMGYAALTMHRVQGAELERGLQRLRSVVEFGVPHPDPEPPVDTLGADPAF